MPPIYFYLPQRYWVQSPPTDPDTNWTGFGIGIYAWTLQTYLRLKAVDFDCQLVSTLPDRGIVLAHRNALRVDGDRLKPNAQTLLICLKAELLPYPYAQRHVVQNPYETAILPASDALPHWPQPALIPRDPNRGDRFETVAFFGHQANLAPELNQPEWIEHLNRLGFRWHPRISTNHWSSDRGIHPQWHDYREVDVVVAVRPCDRVSNRLTRAYISKPATKLYNAWLAGVPAILGRESAYQSERQTDLDYLEANSLTDILTVLQRLRDDPALRQAMIHNGQRRALAIHPSQTTQRWIRFLEDVAIPAYDHWCSQPLWMQQMMLGQRWFTANRMRMAHKLRSPLSRLLCGFWLSVGM